MSDKIHIVSGYSPSDDVVELRSKDGYCVKIYIPLELGNCTIDATNEDYKDEFSIYTLYTIKIYDASGYVIKELKHKRKKEEL